MAKRVRWGRALLNGFVVCLVGSAMYMLPGFAYGVQRASELGPPTSTTSAVGRQIGSEIAFLWEGDWRLLALAIDIVTGLLVLWRARVVAMGAGQSRWLNGLLVGLVPALLWMPFIFLGGPVLAQVLTLAAYLAAGTVGGLLARA
jgi:hypothetical protein